MDPTTKWEPEEQAEALQDQTNVEKEEPEQPLETKKRKKNVLKEDHLVGAKGYRKIYETFPYDMPTPIAGKEEVALNNLITRYKEWAFDLFPNLAFEDFLDRSHPLDRRYAVQGLVNELRSKERERSLALEAQHKPPSLPEEEADEASEVNDGDESSEEEFESNVQFSHPKDQENVDTNQEK